jgi:hypothetical protein
LFCRPEHQAQIAERIRAAAPSEPQVPIDGSTLQEMAGEVIALLESKESLPQELLDATLPLCDFIEFNRELVNRELAESVNNDLWMALQDAHVLALMGGAEYRDA